MYNELYETWRRELAAAELEKLPLDFYSRTAEYLKLLREEERMLDRRTVKASLLSRETRHAKYMIRELIRARYRKLVKAAADGTKIPQGVLTVEEQKIYSGFSPFTEAFRSFARNIIRGHAPKMEVEYEHKRTVLRFLKDVPAIIGADMKTHGPFRAEDVASLPSENAKILVKQHLAEKVDAN